MCAKYEYDLKDLTSAKYKLVLIEKNLQPGCVNSLKLSEAYMHQ